MTREETIKWLESLKAEIGKSEHGTLWHYAEALDMAIEALSEDKTDRLKWRWDVELIQDMQDKANASADRPRGEWIYGEHEYSMCDGYRCSNCGFFVPWDHTHHLRNIDFIKDYNICPHCGADMR